MNPDSYHGDEIAIIGMAGQFPGAKDIDQYWQTLRDGVESISFFSEEELREAGVDAALLKRSNYVRAGALLDHAEDFDASFFNITPREAEMMDPQHRLFLECAWQALESAAYDPKQYKGWIGVYAGVSTNAYLLNIYRDQALFNSLDRAQLLIGNDKDFFTTRVSYKLGLKGPSLTVQTACSTSLVALHIACQAILNGECDMALAGGSAVKSFQKTGYLYQTGSITSPDGHCRAFEAQANGTVGGDGVGVVVLKLLKKALADGDHIHAVIKGSAINNDAHAKIGFTAPSIEGQAEVIMQALSAAGVKAETISYVETHGTATHLGDPIEIAALAQAFNSSSPDREWCALGSVKTNIGHLDIAAGIAGVIKVALALKYHMLPPSLHFQVPNPAIDFAAGHFYVNNTLAHWPERAFPRRAGVSSFGIGGTNAHAIMEEAPVRPPSSSSRPAQLLVLSAITPNALEKMQQNLAQCLEHHPEFHLADVAYTQQIGRRAFEYRRAIVCTSCEDALAKLRKPSLPPIHAANSDEKRVVFMFPGQGVQHVDMLKALYEQEPIFREEVDKCCSILQPLLSFNPLEIIYPRPEAREETHYLLDQTAMAQPCLFTFEYALALLWMSWGIRPAAMVGHSVGEYVAACLAGVLSLEAALTLLVTRGHLMQQLPAGEMLALAMAPEEATTWLEEHPSLSLAAINSPRQCVVAGPPEPIQTLADQLDRRNIKHKRLPVSRAFHSQMVEAVMHAFQDAMAQVQLSPPQIPYLSNLTGDWIKPQEATDPTYWTQHLRHTVRFADALDVLKRESYTLFLEVGPKRTLSSLLRRCYNQVPPKLILAPCSGDSEAEPRVLSSMLEALGRLWAAGVEVDWLNFSAKERRYRLPLPTYPFERQRYRLQVSTVSPGSQPDVTSREESRLHVAEWFSVPSWSQTSLLPVPSSAQKHDGTFWLIFADNLGIGSQLKARLCQAGGYVVLVEMGQETDTLTRLGTDHYALHPGDRTGLAALLTELEQAHRFPQKIIHLWNISTPDQLMVSDEAQLAQLQEQGFYSLLYLAQALEHAQATSHIWVVTNNAQSVTGDEAISPEKSLALGLCKAIPQENPHIKCYNIDIVLAQPDSWQAKKLIDHLIREFEQGTLGTVVAYRNNRRWIQVFQKCSLDNPGSEAPIKIRERGTYLVTGGLGSIGLIMADYLAQQKKNVHLVLVGRSAFPARPDWEDWLNAHEAQDPVSLKIQKLQGMEKLGASITIMQADVADRAQMQQVFERIYRQSEILHGIIYCAGLTGRKTLVPITKLTRTGCEEQFKAKVNGLMVLENVLADYHPLDFCLLQSSLTSVLGGLGQAAYTSANLFMDNFTHRHNRTGSTPWLSLNWDFWQTQEEHDEQAKSRGITIEEGQDVVHRALTAQLVGQLVISTQDLTSRMRQWLEDGFLSTDGLIDQQAQHTDRPNLPGDYVEPGNEIERALIEIWQNDLGIEPIGIHDNFFDLGGDSLVAINIVRRAQERGIPLIPQQFYEYQTIAELAAIVRQA